MVLAFIDMDNLKNPYWGAGQARATREVAKLLAKKHKVTVYCAKYPGWKDYTAEGVKYVHVGWEIHQPQLLNIAFILTAPFVARRISADIIIEEFNAPISITLAPLFTKTPIIALPTMFNAIQFSKKYHVPFHWIEALGMRFYQYMLPYSPIDSAKAKALNPKIIMQVTPQGVGDEFLSIRKKKPEYIFFLGRFDLHQKGVDLLLRAYAKVKNQIGYPLVIAGHGPDEKKIHQLIDELGIRDKVTVVGPAYGEKKAGLISRALYTAFPSRHDEMSIWSLESLGSGLPLIGFDLPESVWGPENVFPKAKSFDVNAYSRLLLKCTHPEVITPMRKAARTFARGFTWQHVANEFERFFAVVLENEKKMQKNSK